MRTKLLLLLLAGQLGLLRGQTTLTLDPDAPGWTDAARFGPGVFYVPKTQEAHDAFLADEGRYNALRLNVVESALNNARNLAECLAYLDQISGTLRTVAGRADKVIFIFEKMPAWLSRSSDGSPARTPGWYVLNTQPPADYAAWDEMVRRVTDRIVKHYGIANAYFEIWNEPDLGSWTASAGEYFRLFRRTYDAIKSVAAGIPVGGPATNHWGNHIHAQPPYGYLTDAVAQGSLIAELIDSSRAWARPLDFISWHQFNLAHQSNRNAREFIARKYAAAGGALPELIVSEWNAPSAVRDSPLHAAFVVKNQREIVAAGIEGNLVAAWQDFEPADREFHGGYGLLTHGALAKPAQHALQLAARLRGKAIEVSSSEPVDVVATVTDDSLYVLVANYAPPPFAEALNHTLFAGRLNAAQLDSAGYLDLASGKFGRLDSMYRGLLPVPANDPVGAAISAAQPVYDHFARLERGDRSFTLDLVDPARVYAGVTVLVDDQSNNARYRYDSLLAAGYDRAGAVRYLREIQGLESTPVAPGNGRISFTLSPNAVRWFRFALAGTVSTRAGKQDGPVSAFPNPTPGRTTLAAAGPIGKLRVYDATGRNVHSADCPGDRYELDLSAFPGGLYSVQLSRWGHTVRVLRR